ASCSSACASTGRSSAAPRRTRSSVLVRRDDRPLGALDREDRARHEVPARRLEEERVADPRRAHVRQNPAVAVEPDGARDAATEREVGSEPLAGAAVADPDALVAADVVLRGARDENAVDATILACIGHGGDLLLGLTL